MFTTSSLTAKWLAIPVRDVAAANVERASRASPGSKLSGSIFGAVNTCHFTKLLTVFPEIPVTARRDISVPRFFLLPPPQQTRQDCRFRAAKVRRAQSAVWNRVSVAS